MCFIGEVTTQTRILNRDKVKLFPGKLDSLDCELWSTKWPTFSPLHESLIGSVTGSPYFCALLQWNINLLFYQISAPIRYQISTNQIAATLVELLFNPILWSYIGLWLEDHVKYPSYKFLKCHCVPVFFCNQTCSQIDVSIVTMKSRPVFQGPEVFYSSPQT